MKNGKSLVRQKYDEFYKWLRLNRGVIQDENYPFGLNEIQDCAILSYDYHDSHFDGWINRHRMAAFERRSRAIENWRGAIPF